MGNGRSNYQLLWNEAAKVYQKEGRLMKLNRTAELALIKIGMDKIIKDLSKKKKIVKKRKGTRWSKARRAKHAKTMLKKWGKKKQEEV